MAKKRASLLERWLDEIYQTTAGSKQAEAAYRRMMKKAQKGRNN